MPPATTVKVAMTPASTILLSTAKRMLNRRARPKTITNAATTAASHRAMARRYPVRLRGETRRALELWPRR